MLRYAITDRARISPQQHAPAALLRQAASLAECGVDFLQLREKDLAPAALAALARELLAILRTQSPAPRLLINTRADVAVAIRADGVHLTSATGELTPTDIRRLYAAAGLPEPIVSVSCHTLAEVAVAHGSSATLILFGPVFEKVLHSRDGPAYGDTLLLEGTGLNLLHLACVTAAPTPVLALGGLTAHNTPAALAAGAAGIAAIRMFLRESSSPLSPAAH